MTANSKVWDQASVQALLATNDAALAKALWKIFQRQTSAERSALQTIEHNGRGFTGRDAKFLSDIARRLPAYDFRMTVPQMRHVRPKMMKYWKQLLEEIEATGGLVSYGRAKSPKSVIAKSPKPDVATSPKSDFAHSPHSEAATSLNHEKATSLKPAIATSLNRDIATSPISDLAKSPDLYDSNPNYGAWA